jgi:hypothetical protein
LSATPRPSFRSRRASPPIAATISPLPLSSFCGRRVSLFTKPTDRLMSALL